MKHSALKTLLAVTIMTTLVALSEPIEWGSFEDIMPYKHADYPDYGGVSREYVAASINFRDIATGNPILNNPKFSMVYFAYFPEYNSYAAVGGLDGCGNSASGWFNYQSEYLRGGLKEGQTANLPGDVGYWRIFVDLNGDGKYGTYSFEDGHMFTPDSDEWIGDYSVKNFTPFSSTGSEALSAGDFYGSYYAVPEPNLTSITIASLQLNHTDTESLALTADLTAAFRNSVLGLEADYNHLAELLYKPSLTTPEWTLLPTVFALTNTTTRITFTNTAPQGFFKVRYKREGR